MAAHRTEEDALGTVNVPSGALWGASTQRAIDNFPVSTRRFPRPFIRALGLIKKAAAEANEELGLVDKRIASAVMQAAEEVAEGKHDAEFPIDVFQTGSGTSTNMNANEVIARLANIALGGSRTAWDPVHPNDHVNRCQSSNDVIPSAIHVAACMEIDEKLIPALERLERSLAKKASEFDHIIKIGRTHLMDAMPVRLGQEFAGWARQVEKGVERLRRAAPALLEIALGGTAVGTGFGAHPEFAKKACRKLSKWTGLAFACAKNPFESLSSHGPCVEASGAIKATAGTLVRIADDIRLLSSGPRLGLAEIRLPALAPGSSIMPGKVNPVVPEMVVQVGTQVAANDLAVFIAAQGGHLELSTQLPVLASNLLESISILANAASIFAARAVDGIEADEARCQQDVEKSLALATALVPKIGYAEAARIAREAARSGKTIREIALEENVASEQELNDLLEISSMTGRKGK